MKLKMSNRFVWALLMLFLTIVACTATGKPTAVPSLAPTAISSATAPIEPSASAQGVSPADLPSQPLDQAGDQDSSSMATAKNVTSGDNFVQGLYERPFNANTMDTYFPYMDIVHIKGYKDDTWGYLEITLAGTDKNGQLPAQYAAELDLDQEGARRIPDPRFQSLFHYLEHTRRPGLEGYRWRCRRCPPDACRC